MCPSGWDKSIFTSPGHGTTCEVYLGMRERSGSWNTAHRGAGAGRPLRIRSRTRKLYLIERPQMSSWSTTRRARQTSSRGAAAVGGDRAGTRRGLCGTMTIDNFRQAGQSSAIPAKPEELKLAERVSKTRMRKDPSSRPLCGVASALVPNLQCFDERPNVPRQRKLSSYRFG
jgi:hypothetical protein